MQGSYAGAVIEIEYVPVTDAAQAAVVRTLLEYWSYWLTRGRPPRARYPRSAVFLQKAMRSRVWKGSRSRAS